MGVMLSGLRRMLSLALVLVWRGMGELRAMCVVLVAWAMCAQICWRSGSEVGWAERRVVQGGEERVFWGRRSMGLWIE